MNSIIWKGVPSTTIKGLLISELPPISRPAMRVKETTIDGRDGSILEDLGYSSYDKEVVIGLHGNFDINKVIKYFTGEGEVVFSNEPDKVYTAKIVGHIDYNRLLRYRQATIPFRVQPFKHKLNEAYKPAQTEVLNGTALVINDIEDAKLKTFSIYGKTTQNGTPTPDNPVELVSVGKSGSITVQNMTIATPNGLRGLPVFSGGNYKDANGQQWICDEIDLARGVIIKRFNTLTLVGDSSENITLHSVNAHGIANFYINIESQPAKSFNLSKCNRLILDDDPIAIATTEGFLMSPPNGIYFRVASSRASNVAGFKTLLGQWNARGSALQVCYALATPLEVQLSAEELAMYNSMTTNYQEVDITNDDSAYMKLEYFLPYEVFNEGMETSKPIMVLKGEGTVVVSVNGLEIFQYTFPEGENEVVIDSEKEDAYLGDVLKNRNMNGEFPVLLPGTNIIEWSGYVSSIEILPRSRWL